MPYPQLQAIMDVYGLTLDDIRWYLSVLMTERLGVYQADPQRLIAYIWSGELADELHDMEETYLEDLESQLATGQSDESKVREILMEAKATKRRRMAAPGNPRQP